MVAIIAILSSGLIVMIGSSQLKARDTGRLDQVKEIQKALSLYQIEVGKFPVHPTTIIITGEDSFSLALEARNVIPEVPPDPNHPNSVYTYQSDNSGGDYTLTFCLDTDSIFGYNQGCGNTIKP